MSSSSTMIQISLIKNSPRSRFWELLTQQWKTCSNINSNQWARSPLHMVLLWSKEEAAKGGSLHTFRTDYFWTSLDIFFSACSQIWQLTRERQMFLWSHRDGPDPLSPQFLESGQHTEPSSVSLHRWQESLQICGSQISARRSQGIRR